MSQTFKLYRLQQIDSQLDNNRQKLNEVIAAIANDEPLNLAIKKSEAADVEWQAARKALNLAEQATRDLRIKIEQVEATLYSGKVTIPKELQDMQNEAAALKRFRSVLEDRQLEAMIIEEEKQAIHRLSLKELELAQQQSHSQKGDLASEQSRLQRDITHLEEERRAAAVTIPEQDFILYEQLRKQRAGVAVAKVADRACSACGSMLSTALLATARTPSQMARCETCGRILYAG